MMPNVLATVPPVAETAPAYALQRPLDVAIAVLLAIASGPALLLAAAAIRCTSAGPAFYTQVRSGLGGRPFRIVKLRTMRHNCEAVSGIRWASSSDPRVTPVGRILRALHIDELPQVWNVLRGEMSIVGPRPERPEIIADLEAKLPEYHSRTRVKPGVTGLAQIQHPADSDLDGAKRKLVWDDCYIASRGIGLDVRILFGTVFYMIGLPYHRVSKLAGLPVPAAAQNGTN